MKSAFLSLLFLALSSCRVFQATGDAFGSLVRTGSCISIDLPPITLTPERTAAERQLLGEEQELEKDGWLIASAQSSLPYEKSPVADARGLPEEIRRLHREEDLLRFYEEWVRRPRSTGTPSSSFPKRWRMRSSR